MCITIGDRGGDDDMEYIYRDMALLALSGVRFINVATIFIVFLRKKMCFFSAVLCEMERVAESSLHIYIYFIVSLLAMAAFFLAEACQDVICVLLKSLLVIFFFFCFLLFCILKEIYVSQLE